MENFEVDASLICEGSFGTVVKVTNKKDREIYAMKRISIDGISHEDVQKACNEIRLLASAHHPNIVKFHDTFVAGTDICIVLEFCCHGDLAQEIESQRSVNKLFGEETIWNYFIQLLEALKFLHENNIVHRDVKPANCFLSHGKTIKLGDMNISIRIKDGFLLTTQTGTPFYMSPEVWQCMPYAQSSDMWALGVILYELCTLLKPFTAGNYQELKAKIIHGRYPQIDSRISCELIKIVTLLLKTEPLERPTAEKLLICQPIKQKRKTALESSMDAFETPRIPLNFTTSDLVKRLLPGCSAARPKAVPPEGVQSVPSNALTLHKQKVIPLDVQSSAKVDWNLSLTRMKCLTLPKHLVFPFKFFRDKTSSNHKTTKVVFQACRSRKKVIAGDITIDRTAKTHQFESIHEKYQS